MKAGRLQAVIGRIITSCSELRNLRYARIKAEGGLSYSLVRQELAHLENIMIGLQQCVEDAELRREAVLEGVNLDFVQRRIRNSLGAVYTLRKRADYAEGLRGTSQGVVLEKKLEDQVTAYENLAIAGMENAVRQMQPKKPFLMRFFRKAGLTTAAGLAFVVGFFGASAPAYGQEAKEEKPAKAVYEKGTGGTEKTSAEKPAEAKKAEEAKKAVFPLDEKELETLLAYDTVEKILDENEIIKDAQIQYVKYNEKKKKSDFEELFSGIDKNAAILLLYENGDKVELAQRNAILASLISTKFNIPIIAYNTELRSMKSDLIPLARKKGYKSLSVPSILLIGKYDLTKGETKEKNNGEIKVLDAIRGAPGNIEWLTKWWKNIQKYWIPTNITEPNGSYVWRALNSEDNQWTKIKYTLPSEVETNKK